MNLRGLFAIAAAKVGKHYNSALTRVLCSFGSSRAGLGILRSEPLNEPAQLLGYAFVNDMLPIAAKLIGDGGLFGTAQPHDVVASL